MSDKYLVDAMLSFFPALVHGGPEWQFVIFDNLVAASDDDVITKFLEQTSYVQDHAGGLYQEFHPEVLSVLPQSSRQLISSKLERGLITLFESQILDDLEKQVTLNDDANLLSEYSGLIDQEPYNASYYMERGKVLANEFEDYERAIQDFDTSIALDTSYVNAYFQRGLSKEKMNDYQGSISDYNSVLQFEPGNTIALCNRAIMKHQIGDYAGAISDYSETLGH